MHTGRGSKTASAAPAVGDPAASSIGEPTAAPVPSANTGQAPTPAVAPIMAGPGKLLCSAPAAEAHVTVPSSVATADPAAATPTAPAGGLTPQAAQPALRSGGGAAAGDEHLDDEDDDIDIMGTPAPGATGTLARCHPVSAVMSKR